MSTIIHVGGAVKATGKGKFEAPLVTFTNADDLDLWGEFFHGDTNFWKEFPTPLPLLYSHGQDKVMGKRLLGAKMTTKGLTEVSLTDAGLWMTGQLDLRDEYEKAVYGMIEAGKMGTSSGSSSHLVETSEVKNSAGKAVGSIDLWPLVEASLTPTPAEPGHVVATKRYNLTAVRSWTNDAAKSAKGILHRDYDDPEDAKDPYAGIGGELTSEGLRTMFYRILWRCSDLLDDADPSGSVEMVNATIDRFSTIAKRYVQAIVAGLTAEGKTAEADAIKSLLADSGRGIPVTVRETETLLRDALGLPRAKAASVAPTLFAMLQRDSGGQGTKPGSSVKTARFRHEAKMREQRIRLGVA